MPFLASVPRGDGKRGSIREAAEFPAAEFGRWFRTIPPNAHLEIAEFKSRTEDKFIRGTSRTAAAASRRA